MNSRRSRVQLAKHVVRRAASFQVSELMRANRPVRRMDAASGEKQFARCTIFLFLPVPLSSV